MKKILIIVALVGIAALAILIKDPAEKQTQAIASIYDNIILQNAATAVQTCKNWTAQLEQAQEGKRSQALNDAFKNLVIAWKKVEATYIAGDLDIQAIDYPRYIDIFHIGNEDITRQMEKVLNSKSTPQKALYKNSYKTINALETVLYRDNDLTARKLAIAKHISDNICLQLGNIERTYQEKRNDLLSDPGKALSLLANALAGQTMMMKDWRVGDPAGLTKKYANRPDPRRAEYYASDLSVPAIQAVLATQNQLVGQQPYANFRELAESYGAKEPLQASQKLLKQAQEEAAKLNKPGFDFNPKDAAALYKLAGELQISYYGNLIEALPVMAKILEADGD